MHEYFYKLARGFKIHCFNQHRKLIYIIEILSKIRNVLFISLFFFFFLSRGGRGGGCLHSWSLVCSHLDWTEISPWVDMFSLWDGRGRLPAFSRLTLSTEKEKLKTKLELNKNKKVSTINLKNYPKKFLNMLRVYWYNLVTSLG